MSFTWEQTKHVLILRPISALVLPPSIQSTDAHIINSSLTIMMGKWCHHSNNQPKALLHLSLSLTEGSCCNAVSWLWHIVAFVFEEKWFWMHWQFCDDHCWRPNAPVWCQHDYSAPRSHNAK
jgi:hypothetical protein